MSQLPRLPISCVCGPLGALLMIPVGVAWSQTPTPTPPAAHATPSLVDAAKAARAARGDNGAVGTKTPIVITNENLADYASKSSLATGDSGGSGGSSKPVTAGSGPNGQSSSDEDAATAQKRDYWQRRYKQQAEHVEAIRREIESLDREIPKLWSDFYSRDDPFYRDGVIKPKLDQALARREALESQLAEGESRLPQIVESARQDGALPGWFRGIEIRTPPTTPTPDPSHLETAPVSDPDTLNRSGDG